MLPADHALRVLDRDAPLAALDEDDRRDDATMTTRGPGAATKSADLALAHELRSVVTIADGKLGDDAGEDDQRDAVADAALGDLLAEPHDERGAGVSVIMVISRKLQPGLKTTDAAARRLDLLEADRDEEALDERQDDRAVARVLGDLAPPGLAFLREAARGAGSTTVSSCRMIDALMYGMMPSAKIESARARRPRTC